MGLDNNRSYLLHRSRHGSTIFIECKNDFFELYESPFSYLDPNNFESLQFYRECCS